MFPLDLLQNLVSLLVPDTAAFLTVFGLLVQHCQQEAANTKLVSPKSLLLSLSKLMDVKTSSGSRSVAWSPLTAVLLTLAGGAEVVSLPSLVPGPLPPPPPGE